MAANADENTPPKTAFTQPEQALLLELIHEAPYRKLYGAYDKNEGITMRWKQAVWKRIAASISSLGVARRSVKAVKQKFKDMKGKVTKYAGSLKETGNQVPGKEPPFFKIITDMIEKAGLNGVPDGIYLRL